MEQTGHLNPEREEQKKTEPLKCTQPLKLIPIPLCLWIGMMCEWWHVLKTGGGVGGCGGGTSALRLNGDPVRMYNAFHPAWSGAQPSQ